MYSFTQKTSSCVCYVRTSINTVASSSTIVGSLVFARKCTRVFEVNLMRLKTTVEKMKFVKLSTSGLEMPIVGLGTWRAQPQEMENAVNIALEAGYRHIGKYVLPINFKKRLIKRETCDTVVNALRTFLRFYKCFLTLFLARIFFCRHCFQLQY